MPRGDGTGPAGMGLGQGRGFRRMFWLAGLLPGCGYLANRWANHRVRK